MRSRIGEYFRGRTRRPSHRVASSTSRAVRASGTDVTQFLINYNLPLPKPRTHSRIRAESAAPITIIASGWPETPRVHVYIYFIETRYRFLNGRVLKSKPRIIVHAIIEDGSPEAHKAMDPFFFSLSLIPFRRSL